MMGKWLCLLVLLVPFLAVCQAAGGNNSSEHNSTIHSETTTKTTVKLTSYSSHLPLTTEATTAFPLTTSKTATSRTKASTAKSRNSTKTVQLTTTKPKYSTTTHSNPSSTTTSKPLTSHHGTTRVRAFDDGFDEDETDMSPVYKATLIVLLIIGVLILLMALAMTIACCLKAYRRRSYDRLEYLNLKPSNYWRFCLQ